jgi:hypothetical protein
MTTTLTTHPKTGRPIQVLPTFEVGDMVTEHVVSDGYPGVVVAVTAKTVWVRRVDFISSFAPDDAPGYNGYGDSGSIAIDPESVEMALAEGKERATKYALYISPRPSTGSFTESDLYGGTFHRATYRRPGASYTSISKGARYRLDPHL